ncbi:hypothetical protein [Pelagibius sp.]|uniref:hypothetical protein n=1 Tax=Pelagibius sp. TaxID=1931238 RepID=UPI003B509DD6
MQDLTPKRSQESDVDALVCLLQGYELYGNMSAPPDCLERLATARAARRRGGP